MTVRERGPRREHVLLCAGLAGAVIVCAAGVQDAGVTEATLVDTEPVLRRSVTAAVPKPEPGRPGAARPTESAKPGALTEHGGRSSQPPSSTTPVTRRIAPDQRPEPTSAGQPEATGTARPAGPERQAAPERNDGDCPGGDAGCTGKERSDGAEG